MSNLHRWKGDNSLSQEFVEKAKTLSIDKGYHKTNVDKEMTQAIDARLELLQPDTIKELLEKFPQEHDI